jgi:hypothetical protein
MTGLSVGHLGHHGTIDGEDDERKAFKVLLEGYAHLILKIITTTVADPV